MPTTRRDPWRRACHGPARRCRCLRARIVLGWKAVNSLSGGIMTDVHQSRTTRRGLLAGSGAVAGAAALGGSPAVALPGEQRRWRTGIRRLAVRARAQDPAPEGRRRAAGDAREIDPDRIEANVRKLASFGTRHTLSSQTDPVRGIGAARDWLLAEFQQYAAESGGRMTAELQSFIQPADGDRVPVDHQDHQRPRDAARRRGRQPDLRRQRPLRLAGHRSQQRHRRRTRRRRRRLGRRGLARARTGDGHASQPVDDGLRSRRRRGAGPLRVEVHGRPVQGARASTSRACSPTTSSAAAAATTARATGTACGCSPRARRHFPARTPTPAPCASPWAARTTRPPATWPGS